MSMDKASILGILKEHERSFRNGRCSCEEYGRKRTFDEHDEHLAEVLAKHIQEQRAISDAPRNSDAPDMRVHSVEMQIRESDAEPWQPIELILMADGNVRWGRINGSNIGGANVR